MTRDFTTAYEAHVWQVYGFFAYRMSRRADAEDLTQLTFERALKAWGRYDPRRASMSTWLLTIARNLLIDEHRSGRSERERSLDTGRLELDGRMAHEDRPDLGLAPDLDRALAGLDERARELLALRFGADLSGVEIAELTGLSLANVQQITSRSLRRLRAELGERPGSGGERADAGRAERPG